EGFEIQHRRDQHDAVEGDAAVHQVAGKPRSARGSVAFAGEEQWRAPALIAGQIEADEVTYAGNITAQAPEFFVELFFDGAAVAGADRVDEYQVALLEPGVGIVFQRVRRRRHAAFGQHLDALGTDVAQVQPYRR